MKLDKIYIAPDGYYSIYGEKISQQNIRSWLDGKKPSVGFLPRISKALSTEFGILGRNGNPRDNLFNRTTGPMQFGELLGLTRRQCQFFIDQLYGLKFRPSLPYMLTKNEARKSITEFGGLYTMYRLDSPYQDPDNLSVTQIPLSIRFPIYMGDKIKPQQYGMRCKAAIPKQRADSTKPFEYDGYACVGEEVWFWNFERRGLSRQRPDIMFITTSGMKEKHDGTSYFEGHLTSSNRDAIGANYWKVVIVKNPHYKISLNNDSKLFGLSTLQNTALHPELITDTTIGLEKEFMLETAKNTPFDDFENCWILKKLMRS